MTAYRFTDPSPVQFNLAGTASAVNGSLTFYDIGTTTPKSTWSNRALSVLNANPVSLNAAGRPATEIWLSGEYSVVLKASDGTTIWTRDIVPEIAPGLAIPSLTGNATKVLTNDATNLLWESRRQLPDPSGSPGWSVVANAGGTDYILQPPAVAPVAPEPDIVVGTASFQAGISSDPTKVLIQVGSGSASASGTRETSATVNFPTAYDVLWNVYITPKGSGVTSLNDIPRFSVTSQSTSSFTVRFFTGENSTFAGWDISGAVAFGWVAYGTKEVP